MFISQCILTVSQALYNIVCVYDYANCIKGASRLQRPNKDNIVSLLLNDTEVCSVMWKSFQLAESVLTPGLLDTYTVVIVVYMYACIHTLYA